MRFRSAHRRRVASETPSREAAWDDLSQSSGCGSFIGIGKWMGNATPYVFKETDSNCNSILYRCNERFAQRFDEILVIITRRNFALHIPQKQFQRSMWKEVGRWVTKPKDCITATYRSVSLITTPSTPMCDAHLAWITASRVSTLLAAPRQRTLQYAAMQISFEHLIH